MMYSLHVLAKVLLPHKVLVSMTRAKQLSRTSEGGQASVEYALVIVAAAVIATVLITWATNTNVLTALFDYVVNVVKGKVS